MAYTLVLFAAFLHAGWNAVLRGGEDRAWSAGWMSIATCLFALPWLPFAGLPGSASIPYLLASSVVHNIYLELLVLAYRKGELGAAYPVARGTSPLLVCLGGLAFAHERLGAASMIGIALITGGILSIATGRLRMDRQTVAISLATGLCIASYTVLDALGVRHAADPLAYNAWLSATYGGVFSLRFALRSGLTGMRGSTRGIALAAGGGIVSVFAYALVTWAMRQGQMGMVSALRETSVVFAAVIGWWILKEPLPARRLVACGTIAVGAVLLAR